MAVAFAGSRANACPCIMADDDAAGRKGARDLAERFLAAGVPCRIISPPESYGDLREWLQAGGLATKDFQAAIAAATIRYPRAWPAGFVIVPNSLARRDLIPALNALSKAHGWGTRLGPVAFSLLVLIETYQGHKKPPHPPQDELARRLGVSVKGVQRCEAILHEAGLLRWRRGRTKRANEYEVDFGPCREQKEPYVQGPRWKLKKK